MNWAGQLSVLGHVSLAMVLGGMIGLERELADKPAGLRTHMLVAATSALLMGIGGTLVQAWDGVPADRISADPIRIVQAIVMGIGFLGAGTIIQRGRADRIQGLTTGASLLLAAAVGLCVSAGQSFLALATTLLALLVLSLLGGLERWLAKQRGMRKGQTSA